MGWFVTLGILVLLGLIPLGVSVIYDEDGALVRVVAGFLKIQVFPVGKKDKKPKKEKKTKKDKKKGEKADMKRLRSIIISFSYRMQPPVVLKD